MKKRTITLALAVIMAFSLAIPAGAVDLSSMSKNEKGSSCNIEIQLETNPDILQLNDGSNANSLTLEESEDNFRRQEKLEKATCAYNSMMSAFYENQPEAKKIYSEDRYTVNGISAEEFPDSFAGAYINSNSDLVVLVPENKTENINDLSSAQSDILKATNSEDIIFASAKYTYSELVSLMDDIYQYLKSGRNGTDGFQIVDFSIDDFNNCVCVGLASNTSESQTAFNQVIKSSDAIIFKYSDPGGFELTGSSALYPGSAISYGSAGYRVKKLEVRNGTLVAVPGFITAAHLYEAECSKGNNVNVLHDNVVCGIARADVWKYGGKVDAVFVETDVYFGQIIANTSSTLYSEIDTALAQGHPVSKSGMKTGVTSGVVKNISRGFVWDNKIYTDFGVSNYNSDKGDSGGIVSSIRTGKNYIAGICQGRYTDQTDGKLYSFFCKASNINSALGVTLY